MRIHSDKPYNELPELPPPLANTETIPILKQESKAAVALAELKGLTKTLPNPWILINAVVLKEAKDSSGIENIVTTQDQLYQAITAQGSSPDPATKEVLRYREALLYGIKEIKQKGFLNTNGIINIQAMLEANQAGIRQLPGTTLQNSLTGKTIYTPPDDHLTILNLMRNFENYLNEIPEAPSALIRLAIQHYQFESIHPFYDGNGRTGRIINVLYLILHHLLEVPVLYLSSYIIAHKSKYYQLLRQVQEKGAWQDWILFILIGVEQVATSTMKQIAYIHQLFDQVSQKVKDTLPRMYSKDLIEQLFINPYTKIELLGKALGIERKAASRYLKRLEEIGVLSCTPMGKESIYIHQELYRFLCDS